MDCKLGQMERAVERSGGVGQKMSKYEAGSLFSERQRYGGRQNQDAEHSNGKKYYEQIL